MFVLPAAASRDDPALSSSVSPLGDSAARGGQELMLYPFFFISFTNPPTPCCPSVSSEVQYVVLQNVATMTIKRRVSFSYSLVCVCVCGGC